MNLSEALARVSTAQAAIIGVCLAAVYYFTMYNDGSVLANQITQSQQTLRQGQAELAKIEETLKDAARYETTAKELGQQMNLILQYVPEKLRISDLMRLLSREAKAAGTNLLGLTEDTTRETEPSTSDLAIFELVQVQLNIEGTFSQIMLFLSDLTRSEQIVTLQKFTLTTKKLVPDGSPMLDLGGTFRGYRYKGTGEVKPTTAPANPAGGGKGA